MGEYLAARNQEQIIDKGYVIEIADNGIGMTQKKSTATTCASVPNGEKTNEETNPRSLAERSWAAKGSANLPPSGSVTE